jgi:hypothetical protein
VRAGTEPRKPSLSKTIQSSPKHFHICAALVLASHRSGLSHVTEGCRYLKRILVVRNSEFNPVLGHYTSQNEIAKPFYTVTSRADDPIRTPIRTPRLIAKPCSSIPPPPPIPSIPHLPSPQSLTSAWLYHSCSSSCALVSYYVSFLFSHSFFPLTHACYVIYISPIRTLLLSKAARLCKCSVFVCLRRSFLLLLLLLGLIDRCRASKLPQPRSSESDAGPSIDLPSILGLGPYLLS